MDNYEYKYLKYKNKYNILKKIIDEQQGGIMTDAVLKKTYPNAEDKLKDLAKELSDKLSSNYNTLHLLDNLKSNLRLYPETKINFITVMLAMLKKFKSENPDKIYVCSYYYFKIIDNNIQDPNKYNTEEFCARFIEISLLLKAEDPLDNTFANLLMERIIAGIPRPRKSDVSGDIKIVISFLSNETIAKLLSLKAIIPIEQLVGLNGIVACSLNPNKPLVENTILLNLVLDICLELSKEKPELLKEKLSETRKSICEFNNTTGPSEIYNSFKDVLKAKITGATPTPTLTLSKKGEAKAKEIVDHINSSTQKIHDLIKKLNILGSKRLTDDYDEKAFKKTNDERHKKIMEQLHYETENQTYITALKRLTKMDYKLA